MRDQEIRMLSIGEIAEAQNEFFKNLQDPEIDMLKRKLSESDPEEIAEPLRDKIEELEGEIEDLESEKNEKDEEIEKLKEEIEELKK